MLTLPAVTSNRGHAQSSREEAMRRTWASSLRGLTLFRESFSRVDRSLAGKGIPDPSRLSSGRAQNISALAVVCTLHPEGWPLPLPFLFDWEEATAESRLILSWEQHNHTCCHLLFLLAAPWTGPGHFQMGNLERNLLAASVGPTATA